MTDPKIRPRRSALYIPGSNSRALEKARSLPADMLIFDLEDSVAPDAKLSARHAIGSALAEGGFGGREILVRINAFESEWGRDDLAFAVASGANGIVVPKVTSAEDIRALEDALDAANSRQEFSLWAMIEMPAAVLALPAIAATAANGRLTGFVLGLNDLAKEMRAEMDTDRTAFLPAITQCIMAARAHRLAVLDSVFNDFSDGDGFVRECQQGRMLGVDGKSLIHPTQIAAANRIFAPSADQLNAARAIVEAFALPENAGKGVISLDGRMAELLHRDEALALLEMQAAIEAL